VSIVLYFSQQVVAQNIKLQVKVVDKEARIVKMLSNLKHQVIVPERHYEIQIGDLYSEEARDLIFQVDLPALDTPTEEYEPISISLEYFDVLSLQLIATSVMSRIARVPMPEIQVLNSSVPQQQQQQKAIANEQLDLQRNRIVAAQALSDARRIADKEGDLSKARGELLKAVNHIQNSRTAQQPLAQAIQQDLNEAMSQMQDKQSYTSVGNKILNTYEDAHNKQRAAKKSTAAAMYSNAAKAEMIFKSANVHKK